MSIGEKIQQLRKESSMSQQELAKHLNVHQTAISQWETGRTTPDAPVITKIADFFGVTTDYLLGINAPKVYKKEAPDLNPELTEDEKEIIKYYQLSSEDGKLLLLKIAMYIAHAASTGYPDQRIPAKQRVIESLARQAGLLSKNQEADAE